MISNISGNNSLNKTPELLKALKEAGVVDSGGKGLVVDDEKMIVKGIKFSLIQDYSVVDGNFHGLSDITTHRACFMFLSGGGVCRFPIGYPDK